MLGAARREGRTLDHILLHGPPGLGKTSLKELSRDDLLIPADFRRDLGVAG